MGALGFWGRSNGGFGFEGRSNGGFGNEIWVGRSVPADPLLASGISGGDFEGTLVHRSCVRRLDGDVSPHL